jgi:glyoxylase-like metal-dependent hydrolase (beta-lactamase superfamily II)
MHAIARQDNYGYLIHDSTSGETVAIDTPDADAYLEALGRRGWKLTQIWNTHHHYDHAGGNKALKDATGCRVVGPEVEADKIPVIDVAVKGGDVVSLGALRANVIDVGGHTKGHIAFHFADFGSVAFALRSPCARNMLVGGSMARPCSSEHTFDPRLRRTRALLAACCLA